METWCQLTIPRFPPIMVSDFGRIRLPSGKITFGNASWAGYKQITLTVSSERRSKSFLAHRLIAFAFIPNPNNLPLINHLDGCKTNNVISNLEWCDQKRNMSHAKSLGMLSGNSGDNHWTRKHPRKVRRGAKCNLALHPLIGEKHSQARLNEKKIREIRKKRASGKLLHELATEYSVCESAICAICTRRRWAHIP